MNSPLFEQQPRSTVADGNYVGEVKAVARDVITPRTGRNAGKEVDVVRWTWWLGEAGEEVESLTGIDPTSEKSNLFAHLVALVGTDRSQWLSLNPENLVGRKALVNVKNDEDGWPKVLGVTPLPASMRQAAAPAPVAETQTVTAADVATVPAAVVAEATPEPLPGLTPAAEDATGDDLPF